MPTSNEETNGSSPWLKGGLAGVTIFAVLLLVIYGLYLTIKAPMGVGEDNTGITWYAQYGDAFGVITSFFTALGTIGLVGTIILQYQTLKAQKEELSETRKEIAGQREELRKQEVAMIAQVKTMELQQVESTFFRLMDKHAKLVTTINENIAGSSFAGSFNEVSNFINESKRKVHLGDGIGFYSNYRMALDYSKSVYQLLNYLDCSNINFDYKVLLVGLFKYNINSAELVFIATSAYYLFENDKFTRLIEMYSFLEGIGTTDSKIVSHFKDEAFGENARMVKGE